MLKKTKLIQLLQTFSAEEFRDFGKFINSPFHNESPKMRIMYSYLKNYFPVFEHKDCSKEKLFSVLYSEKIKYDDTKLRERFSDMLKLAEQYLSMIDYMDDRVTFKRHTLNQYAKRSLRVHFDKKYKEIQDELEKTLVKNNHYFYNYYLQVKDKWIPMEGEKLMLKRIPLFDHAGVEIDSFLRFFLSKMLKYYTIFSGMERLLNYKFEYKLYDTVMKFVEEGDFESYPSIIGFYLLLKLNENTNNDYYFYKLKELVIRHHDKFEIKDISLLYTGLLNNAIRLSSIGKHEYKTECFEINKLSLNSGIYPTESGWMRWASFIFSVQTAIDVGEFDWARKYINDYSEKLAPEFREISVLYVNSRLLFAEKKYRDALKVISRVKPKKLDHNAYLRTRTLLSQIYFEIQDYENILTLIDSFKHYLSSQPMITEREAVKYSNFMNALQKLTLLSINTDEFSIIKLEKEINSFTDYNISHRSWLLEKISNLKKQ